MFGGKVLAPVDCVECLFKPFATQPMEEVHNQYNVDGASQYLPYSWAMQQSWQSDGYMGWNPYTHNGTSLPENTMLSPGGLASLVIWFSSFLDGMGCGNLAAVFYRRAGDDHSTEIQGNSHSVRIAGSCEFQFLFPVYYVDI